MVERELNRLSIVCFVTCAIEELLNILLMQSNYVPKYSQNNDDSEYVSHVGIDRKGADFIGNKQINKHTCKHSALYIITDSNA